MHPLSLKGVILNQVADGIRNNNILHFPMVEHFVNNGEPADNEDSYKEVKFQWIFIVSLQIEDL